MRRTLVAALAVFTIIISASVMTAGQTKSRVRFPAGATGTTLKGTVKGYAYRDYIVGASAGQTMTLSLTSAPSDSVFTIFLPNGDNFEGAAEMNDFSGELPANGDYVVRVGMMRSAARRKGSTANYILKIKIK